MPSFDDSLHLTDGDGRKCFRFRMDSDEDANTLYFRVTSKIMNSGTITFEELAHMYNFYNPEEYLIPSEEQKNIEWRGTSAFFIIPGTHTLWAIEYHRVD